MINLPNRRRARTDGANHSELEHPFVERHEQRVDDSQYDDAKNDQMAMFIVVCLVRLVLLYGLTSVFGTGIRTM